MKREAFLLFALVFFIHISVLSSASIGVSPGTYNIDFKPNLKTNLQFNFIEEENLTLDIFAEGDLAQYVELSTNRLKSSGTVSVSLNLPKEIEVPGTHIIYIGARQSTGENDGFGIVGSIKGIIKITVPYPGKYLTLKTEATNANSGDNVNVTVTINNLGSELTKATGKISIYQNEKYITEIDLGNVELGVSDFKILSNQLNTGSYAAGDYIAAGQIFYGESRVESNASFKIGELVVKMINYTNNLERNKLNRFDIEVESKWNNPIENVYANITIAENAMSFQTPSLNLDSFSSGTLTGFFDTAGIEGNDFDVLIKIYYAGQTTENLVKVSFKKETDYFFFALVIGVIIALLLTIYVTYALKKAERKKKNK